MTPLLCCDLVLFVAITVHCVQVLELNASDTRSKKILHAELSAVLVSQTIKFGSSGSSSSSSSSGKQSTQFSTNKKRVVIMDEVDGMGGSDRYVHVCSSVPTNNTTLQPRGLYWSYIFIYSCVVYVAAITSLYVGCICAMFNKT